MSEHAHLVYADTDHTHTDLVCALVPSDVLKCQLEVVVAAERKKTSEQKDNGKETTWHPSMQSCLITVRCWLWRRPVSSSACEAVLTRTWCSSL